MNRYRIIANNPIHIIFVVISGEEPKAIGIGPIMINPPIWLLPGFCTIERTKPSNTTKKPINVIAAPTLIKFSDTRIWDDIILLLFNASFYWDLKNPIIMYNMEK
jgi:hypothetical protein